MQARSGRGWLVLSRRGLYRLRRSKSIRDSQNVLPVEPTTEQGLSLLECLVAMVVITLTVMTITPPIFLATAARIQSRRADQAMQIAQGEIDRLRVLVERGGYTLNDIPASNGAAVAAAAPTQVADMLRSGNPNCAKPYDGSSIPVSTVLPIDVNGDCQADFLLQSFRNDGTIPPGRTLPINFVLGVRVYSVVALPNLGNLQNPPVAASLNFTTGLGNARLSPLAANYSTLSRNDSAFSLDSLREFCQNNPC